MDAGLHKTSTSSARRVSKANGATGQRPKGDVQDKVYAELRHWLMIGHFLPGEPITLRNLAHMTRERLMELLSLRRELEGLATAQACRNMTDRDLAQIEKIHASTMRALKAGDATRALALNQQFHLSIYALARSWVLMPMIEALWLRAGPFMHLAQGSPGVTWDGRHHVELLRALARRDAKAARRAIQRDISMAGQNLSRMPMLRNGRERGARV
jgi:DNA-binding GntR family transcriptional regulator